MIRYLTFFLVFGSYSCNVNNSLVLIISFDGWRHDYVQKDITPTLYKLTKEGTQTEDLRNVFETKTFPNHHTIATGLYPYVHGVIANKLYDPVLKKVLTYSEELWEVGDEIVPIWIHNERSGDGRFSGVYMWPGSEFKYNNSYPTFIQKYNRSVPWRERVDTVLSWFLHPKTPANLIMMYFEEPDMTSHHSGPGSLPVLQQLKNLDNISQYLIETFERNNLSEKMNIFFLSDHGMAEVKSDNIINITGHLDSQNYDLAGSSPVLHFIPKTGFESDIYNSLKNLSELYNFTVYKKNELPARWLYGQSSRTPPLMAVADLGYGFDDMWRNGIYIYGSHGYDNHLKIMHPFFIAYGPKVKKNYVMKPFDTVDLYNIFCYILSIPFIDTNGTFSHVQDMLISQDELDLLQNLRFTVILLMGIAFVVLSLLIILAVKYFSPSSNYRNQVAYECLTTKEFEEVHLLGMMEIEG